MPRTNVSTIAKLEKASYPRNPQPSNPPPEELRAEKGLDVPIHVDAASGGFIAPFLYPDLQWDFRLKNVKSINVSGHKWVWGSCW